VDGDKVGCGQHGVEVGLVGPELGQDIRGGVRVIDQKRHPQGPGPPCHLRADLPQAHDAQRLPADLATHEALAVELPTLHGGRRLRDIACRRKQHGDGVLSRGQHVAGRAVDHQNAVASGGLNVDVVHPNARAGHHPQPRCGIQHARRHPRCATHNQRLATSQQPDELILSRAANHHSLRHRIEDVNARL